MASPSLSAPASNPSRAPVAGPSKEDSKIELLKEIRGHEVAISELNNLPPSRAVYQKTGNIFFRKNVKAAVTSEQKQLDISKARMQKLDMA